MHNNGPAATRLPIDAASGTHNLQWQYRVLEGINTIFKEALTCDTEMQLGRACLAVAEAITDSEFAFIGEVNTDGCLEDIAISDSGWRACRIANPNGHGKLQTNMKIHGLYGRVMKQATAFFSNDPANHPDRIGLPPGHPQLNAFLGVPLVYADKTIGVIIVGNRKGGYDRDTLNALASLAPTVIEALMRKRAELANKSLKSKLAADLSAMERLHALSMRHLGKSEINPLLKEILDAAVMLTEAEMGTLLMLDPADDAVRLQAHLGFSASPPKTFGYLRFEENAIFSKILHGANRVILTDMTTDSALQQHPYGHALRQAGARALQATPLISRAGRILGILSTYWRKPHHPGNRQLHFIDLLARQAADLIERAQSDALLEKKVQERTAELEKRNAELEALNKTVKKMAHKTIVAMENDRKALSKDLHDSIGGSLAAIKLQLEDRLFRMSSMPPLDAMSFEKILGHLSDTIRETRRISRRLRPLELDDFGLLPALNRNLKDFKQFYPKIALTVRIDISEEQIAEDTKTVLYRVFQEAFNNIGRHSQADAVHFNLFRKEKRVCLRIADNGCGFDCRKILQNTHAFSGYGLSNMRERVEICKGTFNVRSAPGNGTVLDIAIPA